MTVLGAVAFAGSLAYCAWTYAVVWGVPRIGHFSPSALGADLVLFALFAMHHSVAAREPIKRRIASLVGEGSVRTAYVWAASILLALVCAGWRPVGPMAYRHTGVVRIVHDAIQLAGVVLMVRAASRIDPLELAGLRAPRHAELQTAWPYDRIRHPLYAGWILVAFGTAVMTADRLAFAVVSSGYLLMAIPWEEAALRRHFGEAYEAYTRRVRWRVIPFVY